MKKYFLLLLYFTNKPMDSLSIEIPDFEVPANKPMDSLSIEIPDFEVPAAEIFDFDEEIIPKNIQDKLDKLEELSDINRFLHTHPRTEFTNLYLPTNTLKEIKSILKNLSLEDRYQVKAAQKLFYILGDIERNLAQIKTIVTVGRGTKESLLCSAEDRQPELAKEWHKIIDGTESRILKRLVDSTLKPKTTKKEWFKS